MNWEALVPALIGGVVTAGLSIATQAIFYELSARKDRLWKTRDAIAEFVGAAYAYLDALQQAQASGPASATKSDRRHNPSAAVARDRLMAAKAKAFMYSADKHVQADVTKLWQRLDTLEPTRPFPRATVDGADPQLTAIAMLREEVDQWLERMAFDARDRIMAVD